MNATSTSPRRTPEQVVREFCALWDSRDIDGILAACTEDICYANVPRPVMVGREAMRQFISGILTAADKVEFQILAIATADDGNTVLTERVDVFHFGDKQVSAPLMGVFVLRGDKISAWRDYTDLAAFARAMEAIGQRPGPGIA